MYCRSCGEYIEEGWRYCPNCGAKIEKGVDILERFPSFSQFGSLFRDIEEEFRRIEEMFRSSFGDFEREFEPPRDLFKKPFKGGGVSIRITSETGKEPKIEVRTFGDYKDQEPEILRRFGIEEPRNKRERPKPKVTEEPQTEMKRIEDKLIVKIKVPGVESEDDVELRRMEESIEVKAYAKDKAYFTLFTVPPGYRVLSKRLENGELILELGE